MPPPIGVGSVARQSLDRHYRSSSSLRKSPVDCWNVARRPSVGGDASVDILAPRICIGCCLFLSLTNGAPAASICGVVNPDVSSCRGQSHIDCCGAGAFSNSLRRLSKQDQSPECEDMNEKRGNRHRVQRLPQEASPTRPSSTSL